MPRTRAGAGVPAAATSASAMPPGCVPAPRTTFDPAEAHRILLRDGAVILDGCFNASTAARGDTEAGHEVQDAAAAIPAAVFGGKQNIRHQGAVGAKLLGEGTGRLRPGDLGLAPNSPHQDNGWGPSSNDYLLLLCDQPAESGGESYFLDGLAIIDAMHPADQAAFRRVLFGPANYTPVDVPWGQLTWAHPAVWEEPDGRRRLSVGTGGGYETSQWREWPAMEQDPHDQLAGQRLVATFHAMMLAAEPHAPRFELRRGQALLLDNQRVMHAREKMTGQRLVWRVWWWSSSCAAAGAEFAERMEWEAGDAP